MNKQENFEERLSKTLAYILRHHPEEFGLSLDEDGMIDIFKLLDVLYKTKGWTLVKEDLDPLVKDDPKQRYRYDEQENRIGANYGHSIENMKIFYPEIVPPTELFHGTTQDNVATIFKDGLKPQGRNFVHLSASLKEAVNVGLRRDPKPAVFKVLALAAHKAGIVFYRSQNNIYLVKEIPPQFLTIEPQGSRGKRRW
ncbi:MAG: RNA 2'-phosphotransferase [Candidatus Coatesbacteria bacterium]|nr:RNA 2'-phosphotransferase [Candidatus Coatesbacteria bacterium]